MFKFRNVLSALTIVLLVQLLMMPAIGAMHDQHQDQDQEQQEQQQQQRERDGQAQQDLKSANEIIGMDVSNQEGENLGTVEEIVLDQQQQKISYVVLSRGGFLGIGETLYAIPWESFQMQEDQLMLNISQQELEQTESFDRDNWPNMSDPQWQQETRQQYQRNGMQQNGMQDRDGMRRDEEMKPDMDRRQDAERRRDEEMRPEESRRESDGMQENNGMQEQNGQQQQTYQRQQMTQQDQQQELDGRQPRMGQQSESQMQYRKLSEIIGTNVENTQGEDLGSLEDVMISQQAEIKFGVISVGGVLGGQEFVAVPWQSLNVDVQAGTARLDATEQQFEQFAVGSREELTSQLQDQQYVSRLEQQFQPVSGRRDTILGFEPPSQQQRLQAWSKDSEYMQKFKSDQVEEYKGTIESIGSFQPQRGAMPGVRLRIRTEDDQMHTVHLGPRQYIQQQGIQLQRGTEITLRGAKADFRGDQIIIAQSIEIQPSEIEFLNDQGQPQWQPDQLTQGTRQQRQMQQRRQQNGSQQQNGMQQQDQQRREQDGMPQQQQQQLKAWQSDSEYLQKFDSDSVEEYTGTIQALGTFEPERGAASGIKLLVRTEDGQMHTVHIGPRQFIEQKDIQLQRGKEITLKGAEADFQNDSVIIAQSFEIEDQEVELLNDQGQPQWQPDQLMERDGMRQDQQRRQDQERRKDPNCPPTQQQRQNGTM